MEVAPGLAGVMEREDAGVARPSGDFDLTEEAVIAQRSRELGARAPKGDLAVSSRSGWVFGGRSAAAELALTGWRRRESSLQVLER